MKDLKIYYETDKGKSSIDPDFDMTIADLAHHLDLKFQGSGVEIGKGIRDLHYKKEE